mgnify:CR=1 FL=1
MGTALKVIHLAEIFFAAFHNAFDIHGNFGTTIRIEHLTKNASLFSICVTRQTS